MPVRLFLCCAAPCEVAVVLCGWWEVMELVRAANYAARRCALFLLPLRCALFLLLLLCDCLLQPAEEKKTAATLPLRRTHLHHQFPHPATHRAVRSNSFPASSFVIQFCSVAVARAFSCC
mgnify:CR=1 FL=1